MFSRETAELLGDLVDKDIMDDIAKDIAHKETASREQQGRKRAAAKNTGRSQMSKPRVKVCPENEQLTKEAAIMFLPQGIRGCTLNKDTTRKMRWTAAYPVPSEPFTHSAVWNEHRSDAEALRQCLRWAWDAHEAQHPKDSCPWDLDAI